MTHQRGAGRVYSYVLKGSRYVFADERDKKRLLDVVLSVQRRENWPIYAFCIMDDSAYFVMEAQEPGQVLRGGSLVAERFFEAPGREDRQEYGEYVFPERMKKLETLEEIAGQCRRIHRLPLEQGVVTRLEDYWWSSYPTYVGGYEWEQVEQRILLYYFSADPEIAKRRLKRFHCSEKDPFVYKKRLKKENVMQNMENS